MQSLVIDPESGHYCRSFSSERDRLHLKIAEYYGRANYSVQTLPSGMTAISVLMSYFDKTATFLLSDELYCDTERTAKQQGYKYDQVDVCNSEEVIRLFSVTKYDLFFLESCSNPSGKIFDWSLIEKIKELAPKCIICVDNTWVSGCSFNPFTIGANVTIESMTKYISGGTCIGGFILSFDKSLMGYVQRWVKMYGQFIGSDHCRLFLNGLETVKERVKRTAEVAQEVAKRLSEHPERQTVVFPGLESHPCFLLYKKYFRMVPGCLWVHVESKKLSKRKVLAVLSQIEGLKLETSYGGAYSKVDPWPKVDPEGVWFRVAIGYESRAEDVLQSVEKLVKRLKSI